MVQNYTIDCFAAGHVAQTDLQNMENNFACLKSGFSGAAAPANTVGGMRWFDTAQKIFKIRNNGDTAWYGLMHGDVNEKRIVYRDAAMDGYARDAAVTDKVIALKGGAIYVAGAATAGTFAYTGFTADAHTHKWYNYTHGVIANSFDSVGAAENIVTNDPGAFAGIYAYALAGGKLGDDYWTAATGGISITSDGADRPAAAVCILIYLDL